MANPQAEPGANGGAPSRIDLAPSNPFATRWTRPGAIPFDFGDRDSLDELVERLRTNHWCGAIVGAHGSGKSTLLASLIPAIEAVGRTVMLTCLHDGQRRFPHTQRDIDRLGRSAVLVIDGYEQLGRLRRWRLAAHCRRRDCGLVVTSHGACGLPVLFRTEPDLFTVKRLIEHNLPPHGQQIGQADIEQAWRRHSGNVREVLFELYDRFEARRRL